MKKLVKLIAIVLIIISCSLVFVDCTKKTDFYSTYFNNFTSVGAFTTAVSRMNLDTSVSVYSYDSTNEVFVTKKYINNQYSVSDDDAILTLYGFSSLDTQYVSPIYTNILSIYGDYAIVTKPYPYYDSEAGTTSIIDIIGVVKYRGDNAGDRTDFANLDCEYNIAYDQFTFVGDYIAVPGVKIYPTTATNYTTFYDYKTKDKLLEKFKVGCDYSYSMAIYDNILVAVGTGTAYFFSTENVLQNGFLQLGDYDTYKAFPEDTENEYTDLMSIQISYLGNGWFVRTARLESETEFDYYNMILESYDAGTEEGTILYARVRSDLFNFNSKSTVDNDWLLVDSVANQYTYNAFAYTADGINNLAVTEDDRYLYYVPVLNPASFVKDGYSIVYFYYLPYIDDANYTYEVSFCIIDDSGNITRIEDALMPLVFVDGIGIQNIDPTFESLYGDFQYITYNNETVALCEITTGENTFETYYYQNGIVIGSEYNFSDLTIYFGAYDVATGKQVLPFIYTELTPYYGDYAIGMRTVSSASTYYCLDKAGNETVLTDVVNIRQGVYVYESNGLLGVKNYAGDVLVAAQYDSLEVYDTFTTGDTFQKSFVIATSGNNTYISTLE